MQSNERFIDLFRRYTDKRDTPAERDEFMEYLREPGYDALLRGLLREAQEQNRAVYGQPDKNADAIFSAIMKHDAGRENAGTAQAPRRMNTRLLRYAAAAVLAAVIAGAAWQLQRSATPKPAPTIALKPVPAPPPADHRYIILPDGSKVLLNNGSHLRYPPAFTGRRREVYLEGEAYFDIRHDTRKPFIVHAGKVKTVVLGTSFDIKAFPGQRHITVTVTRGKVRVENETGTLGILTRDEQLTVSEGEDTARRQLVKTEEVMSWKADDILFDDTPVSEAVAELEKRFGVTIKLDNPALGNCRVTASFLHRETAEDIIKVISGINHMQYRTDAGNNIVLSGEGCH